MRSSRGPDAIGRLRQGADAMTARAAGLKKLADAAEPLYKSLDDGQKRRFAMLLRMGGRSRPAAATGSAAPTTPAEAEPKTAAAIALPPRRSPRAQSRRARPGGFLVSGVDGPFAQAALLDSPALALLQHAGLRGSPASRPGRIAQLVEQLTLNQRVLGSSS